MPELIESRSQYLECLEENIPKATTIGLSTYNLWAGDQEEKIVKILDGLQESRKPTQLVVGIPKFFSRAPGPNPCLFCAESHRRLLVRLFSYHKQWRLLRWGFHPNSHSKLSIGYNNSNDIIWALIGGFNLTSGDLQDSALLLKGKDLNPTLVKKLHLQFQQLWLESDPDLSALRAEFERNVTQAEPPHQVCPKKEAPSPEELSEFLLALSRYKYLEKTKFTELAKKCAGFINQQEKQLRETTPAELIDSPVVQDALKIYQDQ